jgi:hypothetical protein
MTDGKTCDEGTLNPFYASTLYYELDTLNFWNNMKTT